MADDAGEKTEDPTDQQYRKAREEGNVAKSRELTSGIFLTVSAIFFFAYFPYFLDQCEALVREFYQFRRFHIDIESAKHIFYFCLVMMGKMVLPPFLFFFVITFIVEAAQVGLHISPKALDPKWERVNFFQGLPKFFKLKRKMFDLAKSIMKIVVLGAVAVVVLRSEMPIILRLTDADVMDSSSFMGFLLFELLFKISIVVLLIGILDLAYQKWQHKQDLKMTKQQVKEEYKQMEGDPLVRQRIREIQRENARKRMMEGVPEADFVVANPIHYAVAIKYDPQAGDAPTVIAKGQRLMALKIKDIAREHGIYIHEDPPLAQTLFKTVEIDEAIPENLYRAIAEILSIVYKLKGKKL